jgi:hypothetical protein
MDLSLTLNFTQQLLEYQIVYLNVENLKMKMGSFHFEAFQCPPNYSY